jgi:hypothetical protein
MHAIYNLLESTSEDETELLTKEKRTTITERIKKIRERVKLSFENDVVVMKEKVEARMLKIEKIYAEYQNSGANSGGLNMNNASSSSSSSSSSSTSSTTTTPINWNAVSSAEAPSGSEWWFRAVTLMNERGTLFNTSRSHDFFRSVEAIVNDVHRLENTGQSTGQSRSWNHFNSFVHFCSILSSALEDLNRSRLNACALLLKQCANPNQELVREKSSCKICSKDFGAKGPKCRHCKSLGPFLDYEKNIYSFRKKKEEQQHQVSGENDDENDGSTGSFRNESILFRVLRAMVKEIGRLTPSNSPLYTEGKRSVNDCLDEMKLEHRDLQKLWDRQKERLSIMDTLA